MNHRTDATTGHGRPLTTRQRRTASGASFTKRYTASSITRMVRKAVRSEQPIC